MLEHKGRAHDFDAEIKKSGSADCIERASGKGRLLKHSKQKSLLITLHMTKSMADKCKEMRIQYLDAAGKAYIDKGQIVIIIEGKRLTPETEWLGFYKGILRGKLNPRPYNLPHDIPDSGQLIEPRQYGAQWGGETCRCNNEWVSAALPMVS